MYNQILNDLAYMIKNSKFWPFGAWGLKTGPQTKILQLIWNQGPNIYTILSFEGPSLDNEKVQNFEHFGTPASFLVGP